MNISRRHLLQAVGGVAPLAVLGIPRDAQASMMGHLFDWLNSRPVETPRPGEGILAFAARVLPEVTANDKFYVQSIGHSSPRISRREWRLNIKGEVSAPLSISFADLSALRQEKTWATITCIGNPVGGGQIGNALWEGITAQNSHRAYRRGGRACAAPSPPGSFFARRMTTMIPYPLSRLWIRERSSAPG